MRKNLRTFFFACVLCLGLIFLSACWPGEGELPPRSKGIVAIVYSDLTKSISQEIADRQKQDIGQLFKQLPWNTKFFLFSIDRGTNKPTIYEFIPKKTIVVDSSTEKKAKDDPKNNQIAKETTEYENLTSSLDSYQTSIAKQNGKVSCISNKLNFLPDMIKNMRVTFPEHEVRVIFYSDMIEQCENSFDDKPLNLIRAATDEEEAKHLQDIQNRIDQKFEQVGPERNLESMQTKVYIVLTSQDDKQSPQNLRAIWSAFFVKLGLKPDHLVWANGSQGVLWQVDK